MLGLGGAQSHVPNPVADPKRKAEHHNSKKKNAFSKHPLHDHVIDFFTLLLVDVKPKAKSFITQPKDQQTALHIPESSGGTNFKTCFCRIRWYSLQIRICFLRFRMPYRQFFSSFFFRKNHRFRFFPTTNLAIKNAKNLFAIRFSD